jgi:hypothetical protein
MQRGLITAANVMGSGWGKSQQQVCSSYQKEEKDYTSNSKCVNIRQRSQIMSATASMYCQAEEKDYTSNSKCGKTRQRRKNYTSKSKFVNTRKR